MAEKTNFLVEGDIVGLTREEIDQIEQMYVPGGDTTGSQITTDDIDDVLSRRDISGNEQGSSIRSDIPDDYEGPVSNEEVQEVINN